MAHRSAKDKGTRNGGKGALPRKPRKVPSHVTAAADRAAARSAGKDPLDAVPDRGPSSAAGKPATPLDPPRRSLVPPGEAAAKDGAKLRKYRREFASQARKLCELGATDRELAEFFEVTTVTIWRWRCVHKEFCNALVVGKEKADARVERSLYQRAVGYSYDAVKINQYEGTAVITPYVEHVPPDVGAAKLWLTNRQPEAWREKTEAKHTLDATEPFLKLVQHISNQARPKTIEGKPV
jgi:hypothetical protein